MDLVMSDSARQRVVICEDNPTLRKELEGLVRESGRYELVGSSAYGADVITLLDQVKVDILLLDLQLPDMHGIEVLKHKQRSQPQCETLIVTMFGDEATVLNAIQNGATGYVLKDETELHLLDMMDELLDGGSPITPSVARMVLRSLQPACAQGPMPVQRNSPWFETLPQDLPFEWSEREDQVLAYVAKGYSVQEVADLLQLSVNTIKTHVRRIYKKLSVHSRSQALFEARALGLLDRPFPAALRNRTHS